MLNYLFPMTTEVIQVKKMEGYFHSSEGRISKYKIRKGATEEDSNQKKVSGKEFSV